MEELHRRFWEQALPATFGPCYDNDAAAFTARYPNTAKPLPMGGWAIEVETEEQREYLAELADIPRRS